MGVCFPRDSPGYPVLDGASFRREARYRGSAHLRPDDFRLLATLADVPNADVESGSIAERTSTHHCVHSDAIKDQTVDHLGVSINPGTDSVAVTPTLRPSGATVPPRRFA